MYKRTFYTLIDILIVIINCTAGPTVEGEDVLELRAMASPRVLSSSSDIILPSESQPVSNEETGHILDRITTIYVTDSKKESSDDTVTGNNKNVDITSTSWKSSFTNTTVRQHVFPVGPEATVFHVNNNVVHPISRTPPPYITAKKNGAILALNNDHTRLITSVFPTATFKALQSVSGDRGNDHSNVSRKTIVTRTLNSVDPIGNISSYSTRHAGGNGNRVTSTAYSNWGNTGKTKFINLRQTEMTGNDKPREEEQYVEIIRRKKDNTKKVNISPNNCKKRSDNPGPNTENNDGIINNANGKENTNSIPVAVTKDDSLTTWKPDVTVVPMVDCKIGTNCSGSHGYIIISKFSSGRTLETHITAPEGSFIRLKFNASLFNLQRNESKLMFGNGEIVKENTIGTVFGEMYTHSPMTVSSDKDILYFSSNTHHMWLHLYIKLKVWSLSKVYYEVVPFDSRPHVVMNAPMGEIVSPGFPDPYPSNVHASWLIDVGKGYGIDITVDVLDLDGNWDDFLLIAEGEQLFIGNRAGALSWSLEHMVIRIPRMYRAYIWFRSQNHDQPNKKTGFKLSFKRYGNLTTTPAPTTTPTTLPTPPPLLKTNLTVFALGKTPNEFLEDSMIFRREIAIIAGVYCRQKNISLNYTIQAKHVILNKMAFCHCDCEEDNICVKVTFSVVAFTETGYALPANELQVMILQYGYILSGLSIQLEISKDNFTNWLVGSIGTLAVLMLVFLFVWRERRRSSYERQQIKYHNQYACNGNSFSGSSTFDIKTAKAINPFFEEVSDDEGIDYDPDYGTAAYPASTASSDLVASNSQQSGRVFIGTGHNVDMYGGSYDNRGFSYDEEGNELFNQHHSTAEDGEDTDSVTSSAESSSLSNSAGHSVIGKRSKMQEIPGVRFRTERGGENTTETAL